MPHSQLFLCLSGSEKNESATMMKTKYWLALMMVFILVAVTIFAAPEDSRFNGGNFDGYDLGSTNNVVIPPPPETGLVILIR